MEKKEMIAQIVARVADRLAQAGESVTAEQIAEALAEIDKLPGLLILTQEHGCDCHKLLESSRIKEKYRTSCALLQEYQVDMDSIDTVVLFNLTTEAMCKIASGITDTPYTKLAAEALLSGKKLYAAQEEVELCRYPAGAPGSYRCMMQTKLDKLVSWGLKICPAGKLEDCILGEKALAAETLKENIPAEKAPKGAPVAENPKESAPAEGGAEKEITFCKRVITERDVIEANRNNVKVIRVTERNIVTALARDAAAAGNIRLVKE